jgi:hypothetical protein
MDGILVIRIMITLTFLILAVCGPIAIIQIRKFIKLYVTEHAVLTARVVVLEKALNITPGEPPR